MDLIHNKVLELVRIVSELETAFPGRHFTLDGHLVGSIGEVMAAYYYGLTCIQLPQNYMTDRFLAGKFRLRLHSRITS